MINTPHPNYEAALPSWTRTRDVIAGEDAIKAAGERYLPRVQSHTESEYAAYRSRASFFNAAARTAEGYLGLIFRRPPFFKVPESVSGSAGVGSLDLASKHFLEDADLLGTSFSGYAKTITNETITVGRAGSLIDWETDKEARAYVVMYSAEQILNWRVERVDGRRVPTLITLREWGQPGGGGNPGQNRVGDPDPFGANLVEQIRVLKLVDSSALGEQASSSGSGASRSYTVEIWQQKETQGRNRKLEWALVATNLPLRQGKALATIPFVFHGPTHGRPDIEKTPLNDIIAVNLDHYRLDADYKHGLHYTALPTAWVSGFEKSPNLIIGATTAWVTEAIGATAGFLEFHGHGLTSFERAMDRDERLMAVLGSRLLENQKRVGETAQAIELRQSGENSVLSNIAASVSESLTHVLRWVYWWHSTEPTPDSINDNQALVRLNTDFSLKGITSQELLSIVSAWQSGAISQNSMFELFRKGEILPDGRTNEEERALLTTPSQANPSVGD
jgi:hypothetical protein